MIRASILPSAAGDPRIGGSNRRRGGIKNSGKTAMQRSTRATSSDDAGREQKKETVIGLGSCGLDYLALVAAFPKPDDKLRTEKMEMQGGGNCANALTAAARLGSVRPSLVSRVGNDGAAEAIAAELERDGVCTRFLSRWRQQKDSERQGGGNGDGAEATVVPSPSTYIIVDREGGTRTCIHTPGPAFGAADLEEMMMASDDKTASPSSSLSSALDSASLVFFDGRLAEAALPLADAARARGVPVLVEAERPREGLGELLERATFVTTSAAFPALALSGAAGTLKQEGSGCDEGDARCSPPGAAAAWLLASLPDSVRWVSTTLGARGAVLLERRTEDGDENTAAEEDAASAVDAALAAAEEARRSRSAEEGEGRFAARSSTGAVVGAPGVVSFEKKLRLPRRAAAGGKELIHIRLYASTAAALPGPVVDSTGAGDAFNGALIHALASSLPREQLGSELKSGQQVDSESRFLERALALACVVAGCNCLGLGARGGLPRSAESVSRELLL